MVQPSETIFRYTPSHVIDNSLEFWRKARGHHIKRQHWLLFSTDHKPLLPVFLCDDCHNKGAQTRKLSRDLVFSQFWELDIQDQEVNSLDFREDFPACWWSSLYFHPRAFPLCVCVHMPSAYHIDRMRAGSTLKTQSNFATILQIRSLGLRWNSVERSTQQAWGILMDLWALFSLSLFLSTYLALAT